MTTVSILSFAGALLAVYGHITFTEFVATTIPGLVYGVWLSFHPEVSIDITTNHLKGYAVVGGVMSILSIWYLYRIFSTGQYDTAIYYLVVSLPVVILSGYISIKKSRYILDI